MSSPFETKKKIIKKILNYTIETYIFLSLIEDVKKICYNQNAFLFYVARHSII